MESPGEADSERPSAMARTPVELPNQERLTPLFGNDAKPGSVVVSLSFDDGFASQVEFFELLDELELDSIKGTFYVNSSRLNLEINERDSRDHVKYAGLGFWIAAATAGHEIGSHSVSHLDLSCDEGRAAEGTCQAGHVPIDDVERRRQVCSDGQMLRALGFDVSGFAYPFGRDTLSGTELSGTRALHDLVASCGFDYARDTSGLRRGADADGNNPLAESVPPANGYSIRSYTSITSEVRFEDIRRWILDASDAGGGWVPLVFHHVSDDCLDPEAPDEELGVCFLRDELEALLRWLGRVGDGGAPDSVHVRTLGQVMAEVGSPGAVIVANGDLEDPHSGSVHRPNCFDRFEGRHEQNFTWSSAELERAAAAGRREPQGTSGQFEKLVPTESHPTPMVQMTTRDDRCYLPASPGTRYQLGVRARGSSTTEQPVEGSFAVRLLGVTLDEEGHADPVWRDWELVPKPQRLTDDWDSYTLNLSPLPDDAVGLAFGFRYVSPAPAGDESHELWVDDFTVVQYGNH